MSGSEKRARVPNDVLEAARRAWNDGAYDDLPPSTSDRMEAAIAAAFAARAEAEPAGERPIEDVPAPGASFADDMPDPDHEKWVTRDFGGGGKRLSMSKSALGEFVFHLLRCGGSIVGTYADRPELDRSYVQFAVSLPKGKKDEFEQLSGFVLVKPSYLVPA